MCNLTLKPLETYLHNHNVYGCQTCDDSDLPWRVHALKVTWHFNHMLLQNHVLSWSHYISSTSAYGHQTWDDSDLPWQASHHKVRWPFYQRDELKQPYLHYLTAYGHQTLQDGKLPWWVVNFSNSGFKWENVQSYP